MTTDKQSVPLPRACHAGGNRECEFLEGEGVLPLYRGETERMLRRYFYLSLGLGRLPSLLGGEAFRARISSIRPHTFEDFVIFVHDMERRLEQLAPELLETIAAIVFLDQSQEEAAAALGLSRRQVARRYAAALDELSRRLLVTGLIRASHSSLQEPDCESVCAIRPSPPAATGEPKTHRRRTRRNRPWRSSGCLRRSPRLRCGGQTWEVNAMNRGGPSWPG